MAIYTDIAAELYPPQKGEVPRGVRVHTATASGIGLVRVDIEREGLRRAKGRYITLDMPRFSAIDDKNEAMCGLWQASCALCCPKRGLCWWPALATAP